MKDTKEDHNSNWNTHNDMSDNESGMLNSKLSNKYTHLRKHSPGIMIANHLTITLSYNVMYGIYENQKKK